MAKTDYIPHGFKCDPDLMIPDGGETIVGKDELQRMETIAQKEQTHLVEVLDCEGALFCIAPLPIARWIVREMNKYFEKTNIHMNDLPMKKEFEDDWKR